MSTTVADLRAKISVDGADKAKSDLKGVGDSADTAKSHLSGMGGVMGTLKSAFVSGIGAIAGAMTGLGVINIASDAVGFLKDQVVDLFQQASSQQAVMAQTAAAIKSTGGAAGISAGQVGDLADALARQDGISDDTIQSAENILLTFRAINKDVFPQTTSLVLDMATAMHEDFNSAAIQIGKALQDPIQGVTALRRVGVQLSAQQQQQVKDFMAVGNQAAAQKIIMDELTKEVGGSAEAYGKTFPGMVARFNVSLDQAKEKIGLAILPVLQELMTKYLMPLADWFSARLPAAITILTNFLDNQLVPAVNAVMDSPVVTTIEGWAQSLTKTLAPAVDTATGKLGDKGLTGAGNKATGSLKGIGGGAQEAGTDIDGFVGHVNKGITQIMGLTDAIDPKGAGDTSSHALTPAMRRATVQFDELDAAQKKQAQTTQQQSIPVISGIGDLFGRAGEKIGEFGDDVSKRLPGAMPQIQRFGSFLGDVFGEHGALPGLQNVWDGFWGALSAPVRLAWDTVTGFILAGEDLLQGNLDGFVKDSEKTFQTMLGDVEDFAASIGRLLIGPFQAGLGGIISAVQHFPELFAPEFKKSFERLLVSAGQDIDNFGASLLQQMEIWANRIIGAYNNTLGSLPGVSNLHPIQVIQLPSGGGRTPGIGKRASGGPTSGLFEGAEGDQPELLVKHGIYYAPPGSYVYNAQQTRDILSGGSGGSARGGDTYNITIVGANKSTSQLFDEMKRETDRRKRANG